MSSVTAPSSTSPYSYTGGATASLTPAQSAGAADITSLVSALENNDISGAQKALSQLETDNPQFGKVIENASPNSPLGALASAVQGGDLAGAQSALANIGRIGISAAHHRRHHHHHADSESAAATGTSPTTTSAGVGGSAAGSAAESAGAAGSGTSAASTPTPPQGTGTLLNTSA